MSDRYSKVIGYFAYASSTEIVCTGEACVISGSQRAMRDYIAEIDPEWVEEKHHQKDQVW